MKVEISKRDLELLLFFIARNNGGKKHTLHRSIYDSLYLQFKSSNDEGVNING